MHAARKNHAEDWRMPRFIPKRVLSAWAQWKRKKRKAQFGKPSLRLREEKGIIYRIPRKRLRASLTPYHRVHASHFSFVEQEGFHYTDRRPMESSGRKLIPFFSFNPHLLLRDKDGRVRFSMQYRIDQGVCTINSIQRERSYGAYVKSGENWDYDFKKETANSNAFRSQLGGVHPMEFLLAEFLYRHRREIREGMQVTLDYRYPSYENTGPNYSALIERFFGKTPRGSNYPLNLKKRRVAELLAIP